MKTLLFTLLMCSFFLYGFSTSWNITNVGYAFSPDSLTIDEGDNLNFILESTHNAVEVSQSVWFANGNSPVVGFSVPYGGGTVEAAQLTIGTHFYVCSPHVSMGMKGKVSVRAISGIDVSKNEKDFMVYPNPVIDKFNIKFYLTESKLLEIELFDVQGKLVKILVPKASFSGAFLRSFELQKGMAPGVYIIRMTLDNVHFFKKVIVL